MARTRHGSDSETAPASTGRASNVPRHGAFGSVRRLPSGRWQARYTYETVERKAPRTFPTEADARKWLRLKRAELDSGVRLLADPRKGSNKRFGEFAADWLDRRERGDIGRRPMRPRTRAHYESLLEHLIYPRFGRRTLGSVTPDDIAEWYASLDPDKAVTRAHAYQLVKTIYTAAVRDRLADTNPCTIQAAGTGSKRRKLNVPTAQEVTDIADAMPEGLRLLVMIAAWCGLRQGELLALRRSDLDLRAGTVEVSRAVVRVHGRSTYGPPKSDAGIRTVAIPPHLMPLVKDHLADMTDRTRDALLFPGRDGNPLAIATLYKHFYRAREAAGRPDLRLHDLRHFGAVMAAQAGATMAELMDRMGHSTVDAALRYQHAARGRDAEIAARLSRMASGDAWSAD